MACRMSCATARHGPSVEKHLAQHMASRLPGKVLRARPTTSSQAPLEYMSAFQEIDPGFQGALVKGRLAASSNTQSRHLGSP